MGLPPKANRSSPCVPIGVHPHSSIFLAFTPLLAPTSLCSSDRGHTHTTGILPLPVPKLARLQTSRSNHHKGVAPPSCPRTSRRARIRRRHPGAPKQRSGGRSGGVGYLGRPAAGAGPPGPWDGSGGRGPSLARAGRGKRLRAAGGPSREEGQGPGAGRSPRRASGGRSVSRAEGDVSPRRSAAGPRVPARLPGLREFARRTGDSAGRRSPALTSWRLGPGRRHLEELSFKLARSDGIAPLAQRPASAQPARNAGARAGA